MTVSGGSTVCKLVKTFFLDKDDKHDKSCLTTLVPNNLVAHTV